MNTEDIIQAISAGTCVYAAILHLIIGFRSEPRDRVHLSFAMVSLLFAVYSLNLFLLYAALDDGSLKHYVAIDKWGIATNYLAYASLFWFIAAYAGARQYFVLRILTSLYILIALSNYILPYTWVYTDIELTSVFPPNITIAPWYSIEQVITILLIVVYATYHTGRLFSRGEIAAARPLGIAVWIYAATYAYDGAIEYGLIDSVLIQQYGFLAFIVIMSLHLSGQAVEAEKHVRRLNVELEQRVEKRTAELSTAKTKAEVANRAKSTFLANMSHELRTPLNAILGHAQIMFRDQSLKPDMRHSIEAVNRSGDHLLVLINNVLEMSKIEAGKTVLSPAPFDIDSLLSDMEMMFRDRIIEKGLKFKVTKETETPRVISADRGKISQILINIVSNAIRYTREGGITLIVSVVRANSVTPHLVFEVKDTGEGIEAENLELIFEPFRQSGEVSPQQSGTGLGLAISRQYARMMDGELTVESQVGQGSIFRFMIPAVQAKLAPRETGLTPLQQIVSIAGERREYRVLVVDDEPSNRDVLIRLLLPVGFDIREAGGGQEAIALFESWSPHLILMDIRMPIMDGIEAIQTIKSTGQGRVTPIIGVSASVFKEDKNKVLESGADDFIAKPIQEAELWKKIGQCLKVELLFDDKKRLAADRSETLPLTRERMAGLPKELVEDMRAAVQGGYMERLTELAKGAAANHPGLSQQLQKLIDHYDYEVLSRLFIENINDSGKKDG